MKQKTTKAIVKVEDIQKEINPFIKKAQGLSIKGIKDMENATEYMSFLNKGIKDATAVMETITKPAKETVKAAEAIWKPVINAAKEAVLEIREKMSSYQTEQQRIVDEEKARIAARIGEGKGKLKMDTAMNQIAEVETPETRIETGLGNLNFRTEKVFKVMDVTMLPAEYILPDEVKIRAAMKAGIELPGVEYSTKQVPVNKTK